ncbi:proteasome complex subunit Rpn13 ubiquitin receptor family protein [Histoplasma capsulatum]|uniref:Proteasome complex subunit Rpn13 ubiquitin receptor family protein n=1 Tax=Ajellomyces capsulatus TaxID=5037 RepID=A0A8A1M511_AJECA|nr:proteasome complex subunit Rpn13 ubiquitin receptor family protein [Histoplasma capsulatum]
MSIAPIITFKAGLCDLDTSVSPPRVKPKPAPGYIYLYLEDDLVHFCWRRRSASLDEPELDLVMVPSDGTFTPYNPTSAQNPSNTNRPTNGRVYALKFSSSSQRHLFWLQSGSQHPNGNPAWFSTRDLEVGRIVNALLQGEDIDVAHAISNLPRNSHDGNGGDASLLWYICFVRPLTATKSATTSSDPSSVIQNLLRSLQQSGNQHSGSEAADNLFTTLSDLLQPSSTLPFIESADSEAANHLLSFLPTCLLFLSQSNIDEIPNNIEPGSEAAKSAMQTLTLEQKRDILRRVLRSPQFTQSLGSLTVALRDGGLPSISDALKIPVANNGFMRHGGVPLGGGDAVRAFLEGIKRHVEETSKSGQDKMETD